MRAKFSMVQWKADFGNQSVVLSVPYVKLLFCCLARWRRAALVWIATIVKTLGIMLLLKLSIAACGCD